MNESNYSREEISFILKQYECAYDIIDNTYKIACIFISLSVEKWI